MRSPAMLSMTDACAAQRACLPSHSMEPVWSCVAMVGETGYGCHTFYITEVFRNIVIIADIRLLLCLNIVSCAHINMQFDIFTS